MCEIGALEVVRKALWRVESNRLESVWRTRGGFQDPVGGSKLHI